MGGSVITHKNDDSGRLNSQAIDRILNELSSVKSKKQFVIVHGAGSFGHPIAKKYDMVNGMPSTSPELKPHIVTKLRLKLLELHNFIIKTGENNNLELVSFPPFSSIYQKDDLSFHFDPINLIKSLNRRLIPVFYGDIIMSDKLGFTILSGDTIIKLLCEYLSESGYDISEVIFGTDVGGIYTSDPKTTTNAQHIPNIKLGEIKMNFDLANITVSDVTGGMKGKFENIREILNFSKHVKIIDLTIPDTLLKTLNSESIPQETIIEI